MMRVLLLGGTQDARMLAKELAGREDINATISLAGVTSNPPDFGLDKRIGGFGGVDGLCSYIRDEGIEVLIDATHPYAEQMSRHAAIAAHETGIKRLALNRPAWQAEDGDDWQEFPTWDNLITALPDDAVVFLAAGQDGMRAFDRPRRFSVLARALEQPEGIIYPITLIQSLPLKTAEDEAELLQGHGITHLVCKNSGGTASTAKLQAARKLGLPVLMLARPEMPEGPTYPDMHAIMLAL